MDLRPVVYAFFTNGGKQDPMFAECHSGSTFPKPSLEWLAKKFGGQQHRQQQHQQHLQHQQQPQSHPHHQHQHQPAPQAAPQSNPVGPHQPSSASSPQQQRARPAYMPAEFDGSACEEGSLVRRQLNRAMAKSEQCAMQPVTVRAENMSEFTSEAQCWELFEKAGVVRRVVLGLDKFDKCPVGFGFVEFSSHQGAMDAIRMFNAHLLDGCSVALALEHPTVPEDDTRRFGMRTRVVSADNWQQPVFNRHVTQALETGTKKLGYSVNVCSVPFSRVLTPDAPQLPYRRRKGELKTVCHWGQRKLLMSEIEFLTNYTNPGRDSLIVYAGAAPGSHLAYLCRLFPRVIFECVGNALYTCKASNAIRLRREELTPQVAAEYADRNTYPHVLFISDVRAADPDEGESDAQIRREMSDQMSAHNAIRPEASMLKFRLSWQPGVTPYLDGRVHLPIWGPVTTSESRLVVERGAGMRDWDNTVYESQMFQFNTHTRVALYPHPVPSQHVGAEGLCHCYDCTAELHVLKEYLSKFHKERVDEYSPEELEQELCSMVQDVTKACSSKRTLLDPNPDPEERKRRLLAVENVRQDGSKRPRY